MASKMTCRENLRWAVDPILTCSRDVDDIVHARAKVAINAITGAVVMESKLTDVDEKCSKSEISGSIREISIPPLSVDVARETNEVTARTRIEVKGKTIRDRAKIALDAFEEGLSRAQENCPAIASLF